jgi:hypothetical protein
MASKLEMEKKRLDEDLNAFKNDLDATAAFYVNEDKRKAREKALKGSGQKIANNLQAHYT